VQQTFVLHTQNSATFVLRIQKTAPKSRPKKVNKKWQERWQKSLFLNLSCCCLEPGLVETATNENVFGCTSEIFVSQEVGL